MVAEPPNWPVVIEVPVVAAPPDPAEPPEALLKPDADPFDPFAPLDPLATEPGLRPASTEPPWLALPVTTTEPELDAPPVTLPLALPPLPSPPVALPPMPPLPPVLLPPVALPPAVLPPVVLPPVVPPELPPVLPLVASPPVESPPVTSPPVTSPFPSVPPPSSPDWSRWIEGVELREGAASDGFAKTSALSTSRIAPITRRLDAFPIRPSTHSLFDGQRSEPLAKFRPNLPRPVRSNVAPDPPDELREERNEPLGASAPTGYVSSRLPAPFAMYHRPGLSAPIVDDRRADRAGWLHPPCTRRLPDERSHATDGANHPSAPPYLDRAPNSIAQKCLTGILSALIGYCNNSGPVNVQPERSLHRIERNAMANRSV